MDPDSLDWNQTSAGCLYLRPKAFWRRVWVEVTEDVEMTVGRDVIFRVFLTEGLEELSRTRKPSGSEQ